MSINPSSLTINSGSTGSLTINSGSTIYSGTATWTTTPQYKDPEIVKVKEFSDRIEIIYEEEKCIMWENDKKSSRTFKIIFSCIDGKFNKSERIYGIIEPAREKQYVFFRDNTSAKTI